MSLEQFDALPVSDDGTLPGENKSSSTTARKALMYELLIVVAFGALAYHNAKVRDDEFADITRKVGDRLGKLWDIAHQGMRENRFLRAENDASERRHVRQALVPFRVSEGRVEQLQRWSRMEEVVHIGIPRTVETRREQQARVIVE